MIAQPSHTGIFIDILCGVIGIVFTDSIIGTTKCNHSHNFLSTAHHWDTTHLSVDLIVTKGLIEIITNTATNSKVSVIQYFFMVYIIII